MSLELLAQQRHLYGNSYLTIFPDGQLVPWRTLTLQEFLQYEKEIARGHFPLAVLEDEIFRKCVTEPFFVRQQPHLKAGVVTTVVEAIWDFSLPKTPDQITQTINEVWFEHQQGEYRIIHDFVTTILLAFPYKPEEVYSMGYEQLIQTLILADRKLMELGIRKEPTKIVLLDPEEQATPSPPPPKIDAKALWEEKHPDPYLPKEPPRDVKPIPSGKKGKWYKKSPILETKPTHGIRTDGKDEDPDYFVLGGHERQDLPLERAMMVEDAKVIYADVIKELEKKNKKK